MARADKIEIMAPAGCFESLRAAIKAGADSIYFGIKGLNMRSLGAKNFTVEDLPELVKICEESGVRSYITLNTVMYDEDMDYLKKIADTAKKAGVSAAICMDMAAVGYCNEIGFEVHTSTQTNVSNVEAVKFFSQFADTIVLARELTLDQIKGICDTIKREDIRGKKGELQKIEIFVHGALCVSISGKCYMSLAAFNKSANRGECLQVCRRKYRVFDDETGNELVVDNEYIMSPKDLCTIEIIDKIIESGVSVLKIEGRGRSPDYVYKTVKAYREAVESVIDGSFSDEKVKAWMVELESVFNRGFWQGGYYLGEKLGEWSGVYGSKATKKKIQIGKAINYYSDKKIGDFQLQSDSISLGDTYAITGTTTGYIEGKIESLHTDNGPVKTAKKGEAVSFPVKEKIRKNDKLFKLVESDG
jgi:putative protease